MKFWPWKEKSSGRLFIRHVYVQTDKYGIHHLQNASQLLNSRSPGFTLRRCVAEQWRRWCSFMALRLTSTLRHVLNRKLVIHVNTNPDYIWCWKFLSNSVTILFCKIMETLTFQQLSDGHLNRWFPLEKVQLRLLLLVLCWLQHDFQPSHLV